jgi:hypothetical protein
MRSKSGAREGHGHDRPRATAAGKSGALEADVRRRLRFEADDAFVVLVRGKAPLPFAATGEPGTGGVPRVPLAMSAPIWVDADGDGRALRPTSGFDRAR